MYKFEENFQAALEGFSHAAMLDPGWKEPTLQEQRLLTYLASVAEMVDEKVNQIDFYNLVLKRGNLPLKYYGVFYILDKVFGLGL